MQIDRKLNLVVPVDTPKGTVFVHSEPLSTLVFKRYFLEIAKTFAGINNEGLSIAAGPRVAAMMLERISRELGTWEGEGGVEANLMAEIRRLTNAALPTADGPQMIPWAQVVSGKMLPEEDVEEVENILVFFIVASAMWRGIVRESMIRGAANLWEAQTTSFNSTEWAASLRTSKENANTGGTVQASSIPR